MGTQKYLWLYTARTHPGYVRTQNEDSVLCQETVGLWAVADGMGGHDGGQLASKLVIESLGLISKKLPLMQMVDLVENTVNDANAEILLKAKELFAGRIMGTTVLVLLLSGQEGECLWAGDSRLYLFRNGQLQQITHDHSHVNQLVAQGKVTEETAENHPAAHVITRSVGTAASVELDVVAIDILPQDLFILCTDGLNGELSILEMQQVLSSHDYIEDQADYLLQSVLNKGARDNVSFILVQAIDQTVNR